MHVLSGDAVQPRIVHLHKILEAEGRVPGIHNIAKGKIFVSYSHIGHISPRPAAVPGDGNRTRISLHFAQEAYQATGSDCFGGLIAVDGGGTYVRMYVQIRKQSGYVTCDIPVTVM